MPELAEVEYHRRQWNPGCGRRVLRVDLHKENRVFRETDIGRFAERVPGSLVSGSECRGKQMLFRFSRGIWLGIHLGMAGSLRMEEAGFKPDTHDHLVIHQRNRALVFADKRHFGRVRVHFGQGEPDWWSALPPSLLSDAFTLQALVDFLQRRAGAPMKAVLLLQQRFPGVGNWMADEILWRSRLHPARPAGRVEGRKAAQLRRAIRWVCREALRIVAPTHADPPATWLFPHRWKDGGNCPRCAGRLRRDLIGGRRTCWCPTCQRP